MIILILIFFIFICYFIFKVNECNFKLVKNDKDIKESNVKKENMNENEYKEDELHELLNTLHHYCMDIYRTSCIGLIENYEKKWMK